MYYISVCIIPVAVGSEGGDSVRAEREQLQGRLWDADQHLGAGFRSQSGFQHGVSQKAWRPTFRWSSGPGLHNRFWHEDTLHLSTSQRLSGWGKRVTDTVVPYRTVIPFSPYGKKYSLLDFNRLFKTIQIYLHVCLFYVGIRVDPGEEQHL